jgi:hypothetical protein
MSDPERIGKAQKEIQQLKKIADMTKVSNPEAYGSRIVKSWMDPCERWCREFQKQAFAYNGTTMTFKKVKIGGLGGPTDLINEHNVIVIYNVETGAAIALDVGGRMGFASADGRADNVFDPFKMWEGVDAYEKYREAMKNTLPEHVWDGKWDDK